MTYGRHTIEPIERALEQLFARVLHHCEDEPPQLQEVRVDYDEWRERLCIRAAFRQEGRQNLYHEVFVSAHDLHRDDRRGGSRRWLYDAGRLWSRMYEDHYIRRIERAGAEAAYQAYSTGDFGRGEQLRQLTQRTAEHAREFHVDRGTGPDRTAFTSYAYDEAADFTALSSVTTTATEMRVRQDEMQRRMGSAHRRMAAEMERQMMAAYTLAAYSTGTTTSADGASAPMTMEVLNNAIRALEQNSVSPRWRDAFERDQDAYRTYLRARDDMMLYGNATWFMPSPEVGTPEAQARGLELLKESLTPEQRESYEKNKYFEVKGSDTGTRYRIKHGRQMNIDVLDESGKRKSGICFLPVGGLVAGDCMLAQKCALELEESEALKVANRFG